MTRSILDAVSAMSSRVNTVTPKDNIALRTLTKEVHKGLPKSATEDGLVNWTKWHKQRLAEMYPVREVF